MRPRVSIGRALLRLGSFIQSLPVVIMKPDDLIEFSRQTYKQTNTVESWSDESLVDTGLYPNEMKLLEKLPKSSGSLLLLGVGGGREAIVFARMGFKVTGVDFIPAMVKKAEENAERRGLKIYGLVQDISKLDISMSSFDTIWLSNGMFSCIPTRKNRIIFLKRIFQALKPGGFFVCPFHWDERVTRSSKGDFLRKTFTILTLGNYWYEKGDMLWLNIEFIHAFSSKDILISELKEGGFEVVDIQISEKILKGGAILKKAPTNLLN